MPIVKIFTPQVADTATSQALAADIEKLCIEVLRASPDAIQIVLLNAPSVRGARVLAEAHFRAQPHRDARTLGLFMDGIEASVLQHLRERPRIRCFAIDQAGLHARH